MTTTPQQHLTTVMNHWGDLETALGTPTSVAPFGLGLHAYLNALDTLDAEEVAAVRAARLAERADRPYGVLGERPVPIRLKVHDTMRTVTAVLLDVADQTASSVQRPATAVRSAGPGDEIGLRLALAAAQDEADRRRWSYTNPALRTAPFAAAWLLGRLDNGPGPFRPLNPVQADRIASVARGSAERVEAALDMARLSRPVDHPCPHCRGQLAVHGGDGQAPAVECGSCGWSRTAEIVSGAA